MRPLFFIAVCCMSMLPLDGQYLLLDRGLKDAAEPVVSVRPEAGNSGRFLADRFRVGSSGEVWVIDRVRVWGRFATGGFENATLWGGLESSDPAPGSFDCDCHNLLALNRDARASRLPNSSWRLDFDHLNWSVPGGVEIRFGVNAPRWSAVTVRTRTPHQIKLFDAKGKLVGPHGVESDAGFAVQVWGHLPAKIEIRPDGERWQVKLFDAAHTDLASLRFGPGGAEPVTALLDGPDLVMSFRSAETGIRPGELNACLSGRRENGVPFEGCNLLKGPPH